MVNMIKGARMSVSEVGCELAVAMHVHLALMLCNFHLAIGAQTLLQVPAIELEAAPAPGSRAHFEGAHHRTLSSQTIPPPPSHTLSLRRRSRILAASAPHPFQRQPQPAQRSAFSTASSPQQQWRNQRS